MRIFKVIRIIRTIQIKQMIHFRRIEKIVLQHDNDNDESDD